MESAAGNSRWNYHKHLRTHCSRNHARACKTCTCTIRRNSYDFPQKSAIGEIRYASCLMSPSFSLPPRSQKSGSIRPRSHDRCCELEVRRFHVGRDEGVRPNDLIRATMSSYRCITQKSYRSDGQEERKRGCAAEHVL
jgi:hypothetical protein